MLGKGRGSSAEDSEWKSPRGCLSDLSEYNSSEEEDRPERASQASSSTSRPIRPATLPIIGREEIEQLSIRERIAKKWWRLLSTYLHIRRWQRLFSTTGRALQEYNKVVRDKVSRAYPRQ